MESNGKLSFLDISLSHRGTTFETSVYRKPTYTGLTTKFSSFMPVQYKRNLISTLTTRAFNICSNYFNLHLEFQFLRSTFFRNGFSKRFIDSYLGKQLNNLMNPRKPKITVNKAVVYFPIVFTGKHSFSLKNKLTRLLREFYPQLAVRVIFKPTHTIGNLFKFKDVVPVELQSSVVYKYQCCCNATYIGMTKRQLSVRISEHCGRSLRTNRPIAKPPFSAIRNHSETCDHPLLKTSFSVLASRTNDMELSTVETLYIIKEKPSLCSHERSADSLCF